MHVIVENTFLASFLKIGLNIWEVAGFPNIIVLTPHQCPNIWKKQTKQTALLDARRVDKTE